MRTVLSPRLVPVALALSTLALAGACGDDDKDDPTPTAKTISSIVADSGDFDTLEAALGAADLTSTLAGSGPFTVFAPTDDAFAKLPAGALDALLADKAALTNVLLYHVVDGAVKAETVVTLDKATTKAGIDVKISVVDGKVYLNDTVMVTQTDIMADNGVIHIIDAVLLPPDPEPEPNSIVDIVVGSDDFDTLEAAVVAADLAGTLAEPGPFTVFAPTDAAFDALPAGALDALLANTEALTEVLLYHVVDGAVTAASAMMLDSAMTKAGLELTFDVVDGRLYINGSVMVTQADIVADNGVIHVIDAVLLPPDPEPEPNTIVDIVVGSDDFDTLEAAVIAADLAGTLAGPGPFTVFAPTDAAFDALPAGALDALLADKDALTDVLLYHVVDGAVTAQTVVTLDKATTLAGIDVKISVVDGKVYLNDTVMVTQADVMADNGVIHIIDAVLLPPEPEPEPNTIADIVVGSDDFDTLETAVVAADLAGVLAGPGPFTVFAPTDDAFAKLPAGTIEALLADKATLTDILTYHAVAGELVASDVLAAPYLTMVNGAPALVSLQDGVATINGAVITVTDIRADNGVIHVIDTVILPPPTIAEIVASDDRFETLLAAVTAADLVTTLDTAGPFTVFAPTDAAFEAIPADALAALLADQAALTDVLLFHLVDGIVPASVAVTLTAAPMKNGDTTAVSYVESTSTLTIGGANVIIANVLARNGIIHAIDKVLLPTD